jgi:uncharacterized Tic20 family protein
VSTLHAGLLVDARAPPASRARLAKANEIAAPCFTAIRLPLLASGGRNFARRSDDGSGMTTTSLFQADSRPRQQERIAAAIAHAGTCVAWFLAPLLVYLLERERSRYAANQALQALLWSALGTITSFATCGLAIPVFLVVHLYAAFKALDGSDFEYPLVGTLARQLGT